MTGKSPNSHAGVAGLVVLIVILGVTEKFRGSFVELLGFWGGLIGATLFTGILVFATCLLAKVAWRKSVALASMIPLTLNAFEGVRSSLEPDMGSITAMAVGAVVAVIVGLLAGFLTTRILGITWADVPPKDAVS